MIVAYILLFLLFSLIGGMLDTAYRSLMDKKFASNCFFGIFFCPIYGFGALLMTHLTASMQGIDVLFRVLVYAFSLTFLEYVGALFTEKVLKRKLWDYSKRRLNFQGRINIQHSLYWLFLAIVFEYIYFSLVSPIVSFQFFPMKYEIISGSLFLLLFLILTFRRAKKIS